MCQIMLYEIISYGERCVMSAPGWSEKSSSKVAGSATTEAYPLGTLQGGARPRTPLAAFPTRLG